MAVDAKRVKAVGPPRLKSKQPRASIEQRLKTMAALAVLITAVVRLIELIWKSFW